MEENGREAADQAVGWMIDVSHWREPETVQYARPESSARPCDAYVFVVPIYEALRGLIHPRMAPKVCGRVRAAVWGHRCFVGCGSSVLEVYVGHGDAALSEHV